MSRRGYIKAMSKQTKKVVVDLAIFFKQFKTLIRIILLVSSLAGFSIIGGLLFQLVESPREEYNIEAIKAKRKQLLTDVYALLAHETLEGEDRDEFNIKIQVYESDYLSAIRNGTFFTDGKPNPLWTFRGSTYFCVTTFTQLGYGNMAPKSLLGRFVSVLYACFSIPIGAIVFTDLGHQINNLIRVSWGVIYRSHLSINEKAKEDLDKYERIENALNKSRKKTKFKKMVMPKTKKKDSQKLGWQQLIERINTVKENENTVENEEYINRVKQNTNSSNDAAGNTPRLSASPQNLRKRFSRERSNLKPEASSDVDSCTSRKKRENCQFSWGTREHAKDYINLIDTTLDENIEVRNRPKRTAQSMFKKIIASPFCPFIVRLACFNNILFARFKKKFLNQRLSSMKKATTTTKAVAALQTRNGLKANRASATNRDGVLLANNNNSADVNRGNSVDVNRQSNDRLYGNSGNSSMQFFEGDDEDDADLGSEADMPGFEPSSVIVINVFTMIGYVILGTFITTLWESWDYTDGAWFLIMSVLTVGYGDVIPNDSVFFAYFIPYIILGVAVFSNVISMCMRFLTRVTYLISEIGRDMYNTGNVRSKFHRIRRRGLYARRNWLILRHHVLSGLPDDLIKESRNHKSQLIAREKKLVRDAFRIYFSKNQNIQNIQFLQAEKNKQRAIAMLQLMVAKKRKVDDGTVVTGKIDMGTNYEPPLTFCKRMKLRTKRKYDKLRNALSPNPNYL